MFDYWLHERGYTYVGPNSFYRLTLPEMFRLYEGFTAYKDREEAAAEGVPAEYADEVDVREDPTRQHSTQLREGDIATAKRFTENNT